MQALANVSMNDLQSFYGCSPFCKALCAMKRNGDYVNIPILQNNSFVQEHTQK